MKIKVEFEFSDEEMEKLKDQAYSQGLWVRDYIRTVVKEKIGSSSQR